MIISSSNLQLSGSHSYLEAHSRRESLSMWRDGPGGRQQIDVESSNDTVRLQASSDQLTLSQEALRQPPAAPVVWANLPKVDSAAAVRKADATVPDAEELKLALLRLLVEKFTGHSIRVFDAGGITAAAQAPPPPQSPSPAIDAPAAAPANDRAGWGMTYNFEETHREHEATQFTAKGIVHTADGKEIQLSLELNMSREFVSHTRLSVRTGDALKDPLVINFGGNAAQLTQDKFSFDLDADGTLDQTH
ncbi:MAG: hypothetical protein ACTS5I_05100, partial [Rhodanobacter sp.]